MRLPCPQLVVSALVVALSFFAVAQQSQQPAHNNPLIELLQSKGIITPQEAAAVNQDSTAEEANNRLAKLLVDKGLISEKEYNATLTTVAVKENTAALTPAAVTPKESNATLTPVAVKPKEEHSATARLFKAVYTPQPVLSSSSYQTAQTAVTPPVAHETPIIPAVAPVRVLPIDLPKQGGMIPDIRLGSGANMKIYGFYKASAVSDTASSGGPTFGSQDWPLPLLLADTGPTSDPQFHIKARSFRIGAQTEWVPNHSDFVITGRVEADFEGDYTDVSNRNISSVRSNEFTLRLAWMRLDHKIAGLPWYALFGQDWSILGSSTLPNLFETTGLGVAMGSLYERIPQFRTGVQFHAGDFKIQPEFAIVLPVAASSALTTDQHLRFGDRAGAEANQPGLEARVVFQSPLSHKWKGVAPAQLIFSGHHARVNEIIPHAAQLPTTVTCTVLPCAVNIFTSATVPNVGFTTTTTILNAANCAGASCNLEQLFPRGTQDSNPQNIYTGEIQLPTPWVTLVAKFYRGNDMRFFFAGQLNDVFANLHGLFNVGNGVSESGRAITFGCAAGTAVGQPANTINCQGSPVQAAYLQPVGGTGGFAEMSFPLSRILRANPEGANSGWILHLQYGTDRANYHDAQFGNHLGRTDLDTVSLTYRLNKWVTFVHEASYIATFTANNHEANGVIVPERLPFAGLTTRQAHNWRNEFGPIFTF
jgi:hypothetical protein